MTKSVIVHRMVKQYQKNKNKKITDTTKRSFINKHQIDTEKLKKK